jgi:TP901 family phage tail tape measure protein
MADLQSTIDLIFNGIDNASETARKVGLSLGDLNGRVESLVAPFATVSDRILQTEAALTTLGATLVAVGVHQAGQFNDSFNFTTTLFDTTGPKVGKFRDDILAYASDSTQSIDKINAALQNAIGQGIDYADSLGLMTTAEHLAVGQAAELDDSTSLLASTLNGYGLSIDNASRLSDQFSITVRDGKISVAELSSQLSNVTPLAAAAGVGYDQVGAAIAVLTAQGYQAGPAITGIKQILEGVVKPTQQAADYAASLGLQFNATALQSKGLQGVLIDVQAATGGNVEKMAQLFTTSEGLTAALALSGKGAAAFEKELKAMREETGVTDAAFQKMADNVGLGAQKIKNAIEVAFINLGTPLLDELGTMQSGIARIFSEIGVEFKDGGALRPITQALEAFGVDVGQVIAKIADNLPAALKSVDLSGLIAAYRELGQELGGLFRSFFGDIDLTTVDGLASAIQTVVDSITFLTNASRGIIGAFEPFAKTAGEAVRSFSELDTASQIDFGKFLGAAKAVGEAGLAIGGALLLIGQTSQDIAPYIDAVFGGVKVGVNALQIAFDATVLGLLNIKKSLLEAAIAGLEFSNKLAFTDAATAANNQALVAYRGTLSELNITIGAVTENLDRNAKEFDQGWSQATGEAGTSAERLQDKIEGTRKRLDDFGQGIRQTTGPLSDWSDGLQQATDKLKSQSDLLLDWSSGLTGAQSKLSEITRFGDILKTDSLDPAIQKTQVYSETLGRMVTVYRAANDAHVKATDSFAAVGSSASDSAKKVEEATKKSEDFQVKMEQIASNERIKNIEAIVSINTERLKADTERVKATFSSIDTTIKSTGDLLGSLFGNLVGTDDPFKATKIESQIALENERRQKALDIQKQLAEAEIERIQAQTRALDRGDAILKIDGTGLEPELEAFMWKILKKIRVRANAEYSDYLLGLDPT